MQMLHLMLQTLAVEEVVQINIHVITPMPHLFKQMHRIFMQILDSYILTLRMNLKMQLVSMLMLHSFVRIILLIQIPVAQLLVI